MRQLQLFIIFFAANIITRAQWQPHYGFLKPGIKQVYLTNDSCCPGSGTGVFTSDLYFMVLDSQGKKIRIQTQCPVLHASAKSEFRWYGYQTFIDSSKVELFDSLPEKEKRQRIMKGFDYYSGVLQEKSFSIEHIDFAAEAVYEPIRNEFARYWLKTRDSSLLAMWLKLHDLNSGAAEEGEDETEGELFCQFPEEFCKVLQSAPKNIKAHAIYTLKDAAIYYYVVYKVRISPGYESIIQHYKDLFDETMAKKF